MTQNAVGIDVSKHRLDVLVAPLGLVFSVGNEATGWTELIERTAAWPDAIFAFEASGGYEQGCLAALRAQGRRVHLIEPTRVRFFAKSRGRRAKTDNIDRHMIAAYTQSLPPEEVREPAPKPAKLVELATLRRQLVEQLSRLANQTEHLREAEVLEMIAQQQSLLREQLREVDARLAAESKADPIQREKMRRLCTVPGIGEQTAILLLLHLPELGQVSSRAIAHLLGVAPFADQSGKRDGPRHISGGRKHLRTGLYMPVLTAIRCNPVLKAIYERLRASGKEAKVAIVACMRRLGGMLNAMLRDGRDWSPQHA